VHLGLAMTVPEMDPSAGMERLSLSETEHPRPR
jgi:hypothetical protein